MAFKDTLSKILYGDSDVENDEVINDPDEEYESSSEDTAPVRHTGANVAVGSSIEMKVVKPDSLDSVSQIADHLLDRRTILLNLEDTNRETARRIIDFLQGVAYAINGTLKKVANCTYVITPSNVDVTGEQINENRESADIV